MNGANTQGENVADAGGVHESFLAYAKTVAAEGAEDTLPGLDQTVEQLFFLAYAQVSNWRLLIDHYNKNIFQNGGISNTPYRVGAPSSLTQD